MPVTREELIEKVTAFVERKYGGDWRRCFDEHDEDGDGRLTRDEVAVILARSGIGWRWTHWAVAELVIEAMDKNGDDAVSFDEFRAATRA